MGKEYYKPGDHWLICDQCARKMRYSASTRRWDGLIVHKDPNEGCFETRHPQDFVRARPDNKPPAVIRPEPTDIETEVTIDSSVENAAYNQIPSGTFGNYD